MGGCICIVWLVFDVVLFAAVLVVFFFFCCFVFGGGARGCIFMDRTWGGGGGGGGRCVNVARCNGIANDLPDRVKDPDKIRSSISHRQACVVEQNTLHFQD